MKTTNQFRDEYGIKPDTYKKYKAIAEQQTEKAIGTKQGTQYYLTPAEELALLAVIPPHLIKKSPRQGTPSEPLENPIVTIETTPIAATQVIPTPAGSFDVSAAIARLDGVRGLAYQNPAQMTQAVQAICGAVVQGMEAKASEMRQELDATKKQQYTVEATLDQFNRKVIALQTEMQGTAGTQTASTQALSEALAAVMALGQPTSNQSQQGGNQ